MKIPALTWVADLLHKDWSLIGFISGVAATVFGFILTIGWDIYKMRQDEHDREQTVIRALREELIENKAVADQNVTILNLELDVLAQDKSVIKPLLVLKTGFWDIAKVNLPKTLFVGDRLLKLRNLVSLAEDCNEQIRSRENYRIHNGAMTNFSTTMRLYDEPLLQELNALKASAADCEKLVTP